MTWNYSQKTTELFMNAVQGGPGSHMGEIENPDGLGEHGSITCGDALKLTLRIDKDGERITDAKFQTFGCGSAIASCRAVSR